VPQSPAAAEEHRACQAWHVAREVQVLTPGIRRAEGPKLITGVKDPELVAGDVIARSLPILIRLI